MSDLSDFDDSSFGKTANTEKSGGKEKVTSPKSSGKASEGADEKKAESPKSPSSSLKRAGSTDKLTKPDTGGSGKTSNSDKLEPKAKDGHQKPKERSQTAFYKDLQEVAPVGESATGVLSPPDFFITRIVHDEKVFAPVSGHCIVELKANMYIYGGADKDGRATSSLIKFAPGSNTFNILLVEGANPGPRVGATFVPWRDPKTREHGGMLFGGEDDFQNLQDETWIFFDSGTWKRLPSKGSSPTARKQHAAATSFRTDNVYIFGGFNKNEVLGDGYVLEGETWSRMKQGSGEKPSPRCGHSAILATKRNTDFLYIFGGDLTGRGTGTNELWQYNTTSGSWTRIDDAVGELPMPRWSHAASFFDNRMWISGGQYAGWFKNHTFADFHVYDLGANCWFKCDVAAKELGHHADFGSLTLLPNSKALYMFGGIDYYGLPSSQVFRLAPVCTSVSIQSLRGEILRFAGEIKGMKGECDKCLESMEGSNESMEHLRSEVIGSTAKVQSIESTITKLASRVDEVASSSKAYDDLIKAVKEKTASLDDILVKFSHLEKKFEIMENSIKDLIQKVNTKADLDAVREIGEKLQSIAESDGE